MCARIMIALSLVVLVSASVGIAQTPPAPTPAPQASANPTPQSTTASPATRATVSTSVTTQPAVAGTPLMARVIEVAGSVQHAAEGADPLDADAWHPVEVDMELAADTQIRTGLRSVCTLRFGEQPDETIIQLRRATLASIRDFRRTDDAQRVRVGLGYGTVRGGSSEGALRSDVVVDSTVATLAKRGTEGWQIRIEPITGAFVISLAESGLVEAYSKATGQSRGVRPGEYVTDATIARMWINQNIFNRAVRFYEVEMLTDAEREFVIGETTGYGSIAPDGHDLFRPMSGVRGLGGLPPSANPTAFAAGVVALQTILFQPRLVQRPEGNFGFGSTFRVMAPKQVLRAAVRRAVHPPRR